MVYTENSLEFTKACEYLSWNHDTSTRHRSETNGIAERAVRRVKEGNQDYMNHGRDKRWMVLVFQADEKTLYAMYTEYTPVACITNTTVFSQAQITYVLVAQGREGLSRIVSSFCA